MLDTKAIAHTAPLIYLEEVDSTNNIAADLGRQGAVPFTVVMAERQTAGRGRHGRVWRTFPYQSLAMSIVIPAVDSTLPLVACLSLYQACHDLGIQNIALKWPNDLMFGSRKLAGVLTESYPLSNSTGRFYVLGCGINVNTPEDEDVPEVAGTLAMAVGRPLAREEVAKAFLVRLQKNCTTLEKHGFAPFLTEYQQACITLGKPVVWKEGGREVSGIARDLNADGSILLETPAGMHTCHSGEMIIEH